MHDILYIRTMYIEHVLFLYSDVFKLMPSLPAGENNICAITQYYTHKVFFLYNNGLNSMKCQIKSLR